MAGLRRQHHPPSRRIGEVARSRLHRGKGEQQQGSGHRGGRAKRHRRSQFGREIRDPDYNRRDYAGKPRMPLDRERPKTREKAMLPW